MSKTAGADSLAVRGHIEAYIKELQPVFLEAMLGEKEAGYAMDYLDMSDDEGNEDTEPSKYEIVCNKLKEPFADYVLFHILRDSSSEATITGNVRLKCANVKFIQWAREGNCPIDLVTETNMLIKINQFNL